MSIKLNRALKTYQGHNGWYTVQKIWARIPMTLKDKLTGSELGYLMTAINTAYQDGEKANLD